MRRDISMDIRGRHFGKTISSDARSDIVRVADIWRQARQRHGAGGDMLFGKFSVADCMYAPVATRFVTYGIELDPVCAAYRDAVVALPWMQEWTAAAKAEKEELTF